MRAARRLGLLAALATASACSSPVTEVVVVIDSDVSIPSEASELTVLVSGSKSEHMFRFVAGQSSGGAGASAASLPAFPVTLGIVPGVSGDDPFTVTVALLASDPNFFDELFKVVEQRRYSNVRFVSGQTRALLVALPSGCLCASPGTCPASAPGCGDVDTPALVAFDPAHPPRLTPIDGGVVADAPGDATPEDVPAEHPADVAPEAGPEAPTLDAAADAGADRAAEAAVDASPDAADDAPDAPLLVRGFTCSTKTQCQSGYCVDGVCCESACTCGSCTKSTPGVCVVALAGSDPRNACGMYTCDGAGACATTCTGTFGACGTGCKTGSFCDGAGQCTVSNTGGGLHCIAGSCMCTPGLTCQVPDAGGAGVCQ